MWRKIIPALAERYTAIAPDLRGFGSSSKPLDGYDKKTVAENVYQLIRSLGFERIFLVGHDLGGPAAYAYAAAHRNDVLRLVILDAALTIDDAEFTAAYQKLFHLSFNAEPDIAVALVTGRERTFLSHFYRDCYNPGAFSAADIDEYVAAFSGPGALRSSIAHYSAKSVDLEDRKEMAKTPLEMPILALGGAHSFRNGVLRACKRVGRDVRGGVVEGCGHWIAEEQPTELVNQLFSFLDESAD